MGGEFLNETGWYGYQQVASGNIRETIGSNGQPTTVQMYAPTATSVGSLGDGPNGNLLSIAKVKTTDFFVTDQYTIKRTTLNLGFRFDHYDVFTPDQSQLAYTFPSGVNIAAQTFAETHYLKWNSVVPRLGISHDVMGDGKTVIKANWGLYKFNPGVGVAANANPNQATKSITYAWTDTKVCATCIPGNFNYEPGEEGAETARSLQGAISVDPNLKQPGSTQGTIYLERQLMEGVGLRTGFVYYSVHDQTNTYQPNRPASIYTVPFTFVDRGPDNVVGSADDRNLTFYGIPNPVPANTTQQVVMNQPQNGTYKTYEISINKRQSHNYSLGAGFGYTWKNDYPLTYPNTPNGPFNYDYRDISFKITANVQREVGHQPEPGVPVSGRRELRSHAVGVGAGQLQLHVQRGSRRQLVQHHRVCGRVRRPHPGQSEGVRRPLGEERQARFRRSRPPVRRLLQRLQLVRRRDHHGRDRRVLPAADGDSRTANDAARIPVGVVAKSRVVSRKSEVSRKSQASGRMRRLIRPFLFSRSVRFRISDSVRGVFAHCAP